MKIPEKRKQRIYEWLDTPPSERTLKYAAFRKEIRASNGVFQEVKRLWKIDHLEADHKRVARVQTTALMKKAIDEGRSFIVTPVGDSSYEELKEYDSKAYLRSRSMEADEALMEACKLKNANALTLFKKLTGDLVEKSAVEVTFGFSPAEHIRMARDAERRLREGGMGADGGKSLPERC